MWREEFRKKSTVEQLLAEWKCSQSIVIVRHQLDRKKPHFVSMREMLIAEQLNLWPAIERECPEGKAKHKHPTVEHASLQDVNFPHKHASVLMARPTLNLPS